MAIGFRLTAEAGGGIFDHTMSDHLHWNPAIGRWHAVAQDTTGNDWALWDNDGADPLPGAEGGWSHEVDDVGPADVYVDTRDTASLVNYFDHTGILHTLSFDHATVRYQQWRYNAGTNDWTHLVTNENPGVNTDTVEGNCCLFTDSNGIPWIVYHDLADLKLKAIYRSGGAWTATPIVIEAVASTAAIDNLRVDGMRWKDDGADDAIMVCYSYGVAGGNKWRAAYRKDSAALTAAWSTEDIETGADIDNHLSAQAVQLGSDTKSTICMVTKRGSSNILDFYKRSIGLPGNWSKTAAIRSDSTRAKLCINKEKGEVYVFCGNAAVSPVRIVYRKSEIATISFGADVTVLEDDGIATFNTNLSVPDKPVNAISDLYVLGQSAGNIWWNRIPIDAAATIITPLAVTAVAGRAGPTVVKGSVAVTPAPASAVAGRAAPAVAISGVVIPGAAGAVAGVAGPTLVKGSLTLSGLTASAAGASAGPAPIGAAVRRSRRAVWAGFNRFFAG